MFELVLIHQNSYQVLGLKESAVRSCGNGHRGVDSKQSLTFLSIETEPGKRRSITSGEHPSSPRYAYLSPAMRIFQNHQRLLSVG
jgi:hypothetical protein